MKDIGRRDWMKIAGLSPVLAAAKVAAGQSAGGPGRRKPRVSAVVTVYRENSHADVIVGKILEGFRQDGGPGPDLELASLYVDQTPERDLSRGLAKKHDFPIAPTISEAITLGSNRVQVAGVLSIGEHGDYPYTTDTRQRMYPRRRFFDEIVAAFRQHGGVTPVFNDKHLSYCWTDAKHMYDTARKLRIPLMAGSSLPVARRVPPLDPPIGCEIQEALAVGYGGLESYGFHALEALQCVVERRRGGETGVAAVQALQGDEIWRAAKRQRWSRRLLESGLAAMPGATTDKLETRLAPNSALYLIDYRDGLKSAVCMANGVSRGFGIAIRLRGRPEPLAAWFKLQDEKPYEHFAFLVQAIEHMIHSGRPAYPVERTLLTTGVLDTAMQSLHSTLR